MLVCAACGEEFERTHRFGPKPRRCEPCREAAKRARIGAWRRAHPEAARAASRKWTAANPEKQRERHRRWRRKNPGKIRAKNRAYYKAHQEEQRAAGRARYAANRKRRLEGVRRWAAANPEKVRETARAKRRRRRALIAEAFVEEVDERTVFERDEGRCHICGGSVEPVEASLDHVVPLARGGEHSYANVKLAHRRCNYSKAARLVSEL